MAYLDRYGKRLREYEGDGQLALSDGQTCKCAVHAIQISDGKIFASCYCNDNWPVLAACYNKTAEIASIKATTRDGYELLADKNLMLTWFNHQWKSEESKIELAFLSGNLDCEKKPMTAISSARYGLTNLDFFGNKHTDDGKGGGAWDILAINLSGKAIEIHELPDHKNIMESVEAQRGIEVTCEAAIDLSSTDDLDAATEAIEILCKLLSFSRGTKISWVYYDCYNDAGERVMAFHKNSVVWQYGSLRVIDPRNPNDTVKFIQQAYPNYMLKKDDYRLDIAIEAYLDAKRESGYLETRALKGVVVLEFLRSKHASKKGSEFILSGGQFDKVREAVQAALKEQANSLNIPPDILEQVTKKIGELNRPTFRLAIEKMLVDLGISLPQAELERFIKIRNSLVHRGSFLTKEYWKEYSFVIGMLDRIFLKILSYDGEYLDITNGFKRIGTQPNQQKE